MQICVRWTKPVSWTFRQADRWTAKAMLRDFLKYPEKKSERLNNEAIVLPFLIAQCSNNPNSLEMTPSFHNQNF